jgi:hypothetical protein
MRAREALTILRAAGAKEPIEYFLFLANHADELRLSFNRRLIDLGDFKEFLQELASACDDQVVAEALKTSAEKRLGLTCPRCGHIHEGHRECGVDMGSTAGICRCEWEAAA